MKEILWKKEKHSKRNQKQIKMKKHVKKRINNNKKKISCEIELLMKIS